MQNFFVFIFAVFLISCYSLNIDVIQTGPYFPARDKDKIKLYTDKNLVEHPFGAIAILHSERFDCSVEKQKEIISKAIKIGSKIGADGIIYYFDYGEKNTYALVKERCYFSGLAIRYVNDRIWRKNER